MVKEKDPYPEAFE